MNVTITRIFVREEHLYEMLEDSMFCPLLCGLYSAIQSFIELPFCHTSKVLAAKETYSLLEEITCRVGVIKLGFVVLLFIIFTGFPCI